MASNEAQIFGGQSEAKKAIYLLTSDQKKYIKQIILFFSEDYFENLNIKIGLLIRGVRYAQEERLKKVFVQKLLKKTLLGSPLLSQE